MKFEIEDVDALGRIGIIEKNTNKIITPNLFPVIHPYDNIISATELSEIGAQCLFTNAYILYQKKELKDEVIKKGIHNFLNFKGIIATDSGAFQQYMYNNKIEIKPEEIEKFQEEIGSDFPVILDLPVQLNDSGEVAREKIIENIRRAKDNISRRKNQDCNWFGPIHGGIHHDLLKKSTKEMSDLDFALHAIGGLVKPFLDYRFKLTIDMLLTVKKHVITNRPLHMFGLGLPQFFSLAVACGCDLMDSAAYILYAKENRYFTLSTGTKNLEELSEFPCNCPICSEFTPDEVKKFEDNFRIELLAKHNLYVSFSELKTIRQAIREGNLLNLVETRIRNHPNLVNAYNSIKNNSNFIELYEKSYKPRGHLFSSIESVNRPIFHRYKQKILHNYRIPPNVRFSLLLPELDSRGRNSPEIQKWIEIIERNELLDAELLNIVFLSPIFGLIPIELSEINPYGQHERIDLDQLSENALEILKIFYNKNASQHDLIGVLLPKTFLNQFNEEVIFPSDSPIFQVKDYLEDTYGKKVVVFSDISSILNSFRKSMEK
jgi:7-cyano-7-deazaguanine tRNA-ribosyltransferase